MEDTPTGIAPTPEETAAAGAAAKPTSPRLQRKRRVAERERDLELTAKLVLRGLTPTQIAEELSRSRPYSLSRTQIYYDLETLRGWWLAAANRTFAKAQAEELARLQHIEREAWEAWDRSKVDGPGDPRHTGTILSAIDRRAKLLGLFAPVKNEVSGPAGAALAVEVRQSAPVLSEADKTRLVAKYVSLASRATDANEQN